ncbi:MAG: CheR family methyltransferase, partial [Bacteroidota bacterium]
RTEVPAFAQPWLRVDGGTVLLRHELTAAIDWRQVNLVDDVEVSALGVFDVILCRNVLIYFNDETVRQVVTRLTARMRVGGVLFVGISESLMRFGSPLRCEEQGGVFLYKKTP